MSHREVAPGVFEIERGVRVMEFMGQKKVVSFGNDKADRLRRRYELIGTMIETGKKMGVGGEWDGFEKVFNDILDRMVAVYNECDSQETFFNTLLRHTSNERIFTLIPASKKNYEKLVDCFYDVHPEIDHRPPTGMRTPAKIALFAIGAPIAFLIGCMMGASAHAAKEREEKEEEERLNKAVNKALADLEEKKKRGY